MKALSVPNKISAAASTIRVLPTPDGPRKRRLASGRPGSFSPAVNISYVLTNWRTARSCPTTRFSKPSCKASAASDSLLVSAFKPFIILHSTLRSHDCLQTSRHRGWCHHQRRDGCGRKLRDRRNHQLLQTLVERNQGLRQG